MLARMSQHLLRQTVTNTEAISVDQTTMKHLLDLDGAAGNENAVSAYLASRYAELADEVIYDNLGSIYAVKKSATPNAKRVMVSGHMDELGFIVKEANADGTLAALTLGSVKAKSLLGAPVRLTKTDGHVIDGTLLPVNVKDDAVTDKGVVRIDAGFASKAEADAAVTVGDRFVFGTPTRQNDGSTRVFAKSWNGRYAPILGLELLTAVKDMALPFDLYVGCTVQETVGLRGIQTATNLVAPDLGIVLDTDQAFDTQSDAQDKIGVLGDGLLVNFFDRSVLPNRLLIHDLKACCQAENLPFQFYYSLGDSDAAWINKLRTGTPTLFINVPVRNVDTPSQVADLGDVQAASSALLAFVKALTPDKVEAYKAENR